MQIDFQCRDRDLWIVATDNWLNLMDAKLLPAGTDTLRAFLLEILRYHDEGWTVSEFSSHRTLLFVSKLYESQRRVFMTSDDPREAPRHHAVRVGLLR